MFRPWNETGDVRKWHERDVLCVPTVSLRHQFGPGTREMVNHLLRTGRGFEADLHLDQLGNRAAGLRLCCDRLKRVLVNAWYSGGDGEMDRGDGKAIAVLVDDDFRFAVDLLRREVRHAE